MDNTTGTLFIVPTPIGNLADITFRAVNVLKEVNLVLAEDTRTSKKLFQHYDITTPLQSYHLHNEHQKVEHFAQLLKRGENLALISDAGTPGISDPGFLLIREAIAEKIRVESLPGPSASITAIVGSGLPMEKFTFEGFLPVKKGRQTRLKQLALETKTIILYESPHRIGKTVNQLKEHLGGDKQIVIAREISKIHEEYIRGSIDECLEVLENKKIKGEIVLLISP